MTEPSPPRDEALKRFDERYEALERSTQARPRRFDAEVGVQAGYRVLGELLGGILGGLGLGWVADRTFGTTPWGLIGGVVIGTAMAVYLVARSAGRMGRGAAPADRKQDDGRGPRGEDT
jgi:ATP synthase protein I